MQLPDGHEIGQMQAQEVVTLREWAASEGWNPGLNDLSLVWDIAPDSFVALRKGSELIGGGSILNYGAEFGFMGLFILRADARGKGLGTALWHWRRDTLLNRLRPGASIAMDGVFDMVPFYERGGFKPAYQVFRYEGLAQSGVSENVVPITEEDFAEIQAYDAPISRVSRTAFLRRWVLQPGGYAVACRRDGMIAGYGVARPCETGFKIGPLFADTPQIAQGIGSALMARFKGEQVQIDIPEPNQAALDWVEALGLQRVFGCTRLYYGSPLPLPLEKVFSVTSLEFG